MMTSWTKIAVVLIVFSMASLAGCANRLECNSICGKYQECFKSDYDVDACVDSCVEKSKKKEDFSRKVEMCQVCIDERACSESAFGCATKCIGIVP